MNGNQRYGANLFYWYAYGYRSLQAALDAIEDMYADGDVMPGENPRIEAYRNKEGEKRYGIRVN